MPEIREILIVVNTAEVREGTQAVHQLADATDQAGRQVRETSVAIRISEQATRAQEEATRAAADAARVLGGQSSDASDAVLKAAEAVDGFAKASLKIGEGGLNANVGQIKDGLGEMADATGLTEMAVSRLGAGPVLALKMLAEMAAFAADSFVQGQLESDKFAQALVLTGNAAGITEGQFNAMVSTVAESSGTGLGDARTVMQALVETGQLTGESLGAVGAAALTMSKISGESAASAAADFATMADGVINWVDTHDSKYNILTGAQYQHIAALEEEGKTQQAMTEVSNLINAGLQTRVEKLSKIGELLQSGKGLWSSFMDNMRSIGRAETPDEEIKKIGQRTAEVHATRLMFPGQHPAARLTDSQLEQFDKGQEKEMAGALGRKADADGKARAQRDESKRNAESRQGLKDIEEMQKRYATRADSEVAAIKKLDESVANARAGGATVSPEAEQKLRKNIQASFASPQKVAPPPPPGSDPREAQLAGQMQAIQSQLRLKNDEYDRLAKLDETRRKGGALADNEYFASRMAAINARGQAEMQAYRDQAAALQGFQAKTPQGRQENTNKIAEAGAAEMRAKQKMDADLKQLDEVASQQKAEMAKKQEKDAEEKKAKETAAIKAAYEQQWKDITDGAKGLGEALEKVFGKVGGTIGKMAAALVDYKKSQADIQQTLGVDKGAAKGDQTKESAAQAKADAASTQAQLKGYGDLAGAAKGFFKEKSSGYKLMEGAEKSFRAFQLAAQMEELATSLFVSSASATGVVAGQMVETTAVTAGQATQNAAKVPGVFMSFMSAMGPWGTAAAAAAIAAVLGGASGGGGADTTAKDRQAANGTGTVLGDSSAKSESIANSLTIMEKNSGLGLAYSSSMVVSLKQIVSGIGGLGSLLVRSDSLTATLATKGSASGGMLGNIANSIFGGKTSVIDTGIVTSQSTLGELDKSGIAVNAYVDTKKSGGWFSSDKYRTALSSLGSETGDQFTKIILGLRATIVAASDTLGLGGDAFAARLNTFVVNLGKISLKDLKGEELQKALEAAFSKLGDDMAKFGVGGLEKYQQVGEGYLETLARVANNYMQVSDVLAVLGKSFQVTGLGAVALSENLIDAAGDLDALTSGTGFFVDNFLTEAERMAPITRSVNDAMGKLGLAGVTTMDGFKAAVLNAADGVALGKDGAAQLYAGLLALAEPFKTAADYAADLAAATGDYAAVTRTAAEIASERKDLQSQLEQLSLSAMQLRAKERGALDAGNRALFDQVAARQDLASAYETESTAISGTIDKLKTFAGELKTFRDGLALGNLSPLSLSAKAAEAQRQYREMLGKASAGDAAAQSGLSGAASAYLTASQAASGTAIQYARDYAQVQADMAIMAASVGSQVTAAEAQQLALDKQVAGLVKLNDSVNAGAATVAQAIATLGLLGVSRVASTAAAGPASASQAGVSAGEGAPTALEPRNFAAQASLGNEALVNEIKGLREDNRALKEELTSFKVQSQTENVAIVQSVGKLSRLADRWDADGMPTRELA